MQIISEIQAILTCFNTTNNLNLAVDTIRADFMPKNAYRSSTKMNAFLSLPKAYKLQWHKLKKSDFNYVKLKKYLNKDELKSVYQLENERIYYYYKQSQDKVKPTASLVIYGLKQYHHKPTNPNLILELLNLVGNISSLDLCFDSETPFNLRALETKFKIQTYQETTHYINETGIYSIPHICIYDKGLKNGLCKPLYRIEAITYINGYNIRNRRLALDTPTERLEMQLLQAMSDFQDIIRLAMSQPRTRLSRLHK